MFDFSIFQTNAKLAQDTATQLMLASAEYTKAVVASTTQYTAQVQDQLTTVFKPGMDAFTSFSKKA